MRRFMQFLGILLVLVVLYVLVAGLGLGRVFKRHKIITKTLMMNDFEYPRDDYDWTTGGYAKVEPSTENQTHGKKCAKVSFFSTRQFYVTPVPGVSPMNSSQVFYSSAGQSTWRPEITLDNTSVTKLSVFEWQEYTDLKLDVFNDQAQPVSYYIQIVDSHAFVYDTSGTLTPKKVTNITVPLEELIKERLDLVNIRTFKFSVNMAGLPEPLVVYLDNLRLEGDASVPGPKKEAPQKKPTP